jgi:hypothetical protein
MIAGANKESESNMMAIRCIKTLVQKFKVQNFKGIQRIKNLKSNAL